MSNMIKWLKAVVPLLIAGIAMTATVGWIDGPQSTLSSVGPVGKMQQNVFFVSYLVAVFVFILVGSLFAYCLQNFRAPADLSADTPLPDQGHGNPLFEVGIIFASVLLVGIIAVPTIQGIFYMGNLPKQDVAAVKIRVTGMQWWWKFEYPEEGIVTGNEIAIPVGRAVAFDLIAPDVIHSFWIPKLGGKTDVMPGQVNTMWLQGDVPGLYYGQCAEFCGESHAFMRFRVRVLPQDEYDAWIANQKKGVANVNPEIAKLMSQKQCFACHQLRGLPGALGQVGPDLTHIGSRASVAAGIMDNQVVGAQGVVEDKTYENLYSWIIAPGWHKPGNTMWKAGYQQLKIDVSQDDAAKMASFLSTLK
jgi:cytochrome c oxidase subunit 2